MYKRLFTVFLPFSSFLLSYLKKKVITVSFSFEEKKNILVRLFIAKRGRYNRPFLHLATMGVLGAGVVLAPFLSHTYPVFSKDAEAQNFEQTGQSIIVGENVFQTDISQKPRDQIVSYTVQKGDTISTIAEKFGVSANTIRWENNLANDNITDGEVLKILPVSGMAYKVQKGDSVYSIAKKLDTEPQKIVDFPFNDFANPETFSLVDGQILFVPDGVKPSAQPFIRRQYVVAQGPVSISGAGFTWPLRGVISQFAAWYHMGIDITSPVGTPIVAAQNGRVVKAVSGVWDGGYGTNIEIDGGNGFRTLYAHLSGINVRLGQEVSAGKTVIGWVGLTGRTTGSHVHFEIRRNGSLVNPIGFLQ